MRKNKRPEWCPHPDCIFKMNTQDLICSGDLPKPEAHDNDTNEHRICTDERETGHGIHDLQINRTDAWTFKRHMDRILALKPPGNTQKMSAKEIIKALEELNPYPEDVFTPPTDEEWKRVAPLLKENGIVPDRIFGKFGRMVWANCINKLKEQL